MKTSIMIWMLIFALSSCSGVSAQQQRQQHAFEPLEPRTQLEALQLKTGAVIVRGSQRVGVARGQAQGRVEVAALEIIDTGGNRRARGLSLTIEEAGAGGREAVAFIDYDELPGLLEGLESMSRLDRGETLFSNFEISYRTRGDLVVSVFSSRSGIVRCVVSGGALVEAAVTFPAEEVGNLRTLIATAKNRLDETRAK